MKVTNQYQQQVREALLNVRKKYTGEDSAFIIKYGLTLREFNCIKAGGCGDSFLRNSQWISMGRELGIEPGKKPWKVAKTEVFEKISTEVGFCKEHSKAMMLVDDCEMGKTFTGKYLGRNLENCFYLDCSQCQTSREFIRALATAIGLDNAGVIYSVKANIKQYLRTLDTPVILLDEAGDLDNNAWLLVKEFWNATDGYCGWYAMGADGLKTKMENGIKYQKQGWRELFSRFSSKFRRISPVDKKERTKFYRDLCSQVLSANCSDAVKVKELTMACIANDATGENGGLRRAESLLILSTQN